jgi:uncharacterized protein
VALFSPAGLLGGVVITGTVLSAVALLGARVDGEPWRVRLRLHPTRIPASHLALAAAGMVGVGLVLDVILVLLGWSASGALGMIAEAVASMSGPVLVLAVVVLGVVAGTGEELFFRGFLQTRLRQRFGPRWAIAVTALVFGVFHCDPWHSPTAAVMGVYLGWLAERTGSLRPPIAAHVVNNALYVPMVVWGPEEIPPAGYAGLVALGTALAATAVWLLARAYAPAATPLPGPAEPEPAPSASPGAPEDPDPAPDPPVSLL